MGRGAAANLATPNAGLNGTWATFAVMTVRTEIHVMRSVYLDNAASAPLRPEVREAMIAHLGADDGNPSSAHGWGRRARAALDDARDRLAATLGAAPPEIVFTRGGTEADNLAVFGRAAAAGGAPIVCSGVEHPAVRDAVQSLTQRGIATHQLPVNGDGVTEAAALEPLLPLEPGLVSVMWANNETGALQPIEHLAARCDDAGICFHSDAVQAFGRVPIRVDETPVALLSLSAHKIGGPRGVGALFVRRGTGVEPLLRGGSQESGLRPGTEDVTGAVGFALAAELAVQEREAEATRLAALRDRLEAGLRAATPELVVLAAGAERLPHLCQVALCGAQREAILVALDLEGVAVSAGSACATGAARPSHVHRAMGVADDVAAGAIRFSLGHATTDDEVELAIAAWKRVVERIAAVAA